MTFIDTDNPNKYRVIKKQLVPFDISGYTKTKVGKGDGGYVIDPERVDTVLSYGIGDDPEGVSFELECLNRGCLVHMYDGSVESFPNKKPITGLAEFTSQHLTAENFKQHLAKLPHKSISNSVLKMDIEGHEYDWGTFENIKLAARRFGQFTIEVHSLIEECPEGWELEPQLAEAKENKDKVLSFFKRLNKYFTLWHIHGNNHSPRYVDLPDSLELTYVNKSIIASSFKTCSAFPIIGLDEPNYEGRGDYVLDWWL